MKDGQYVQQSGPKNSLGLVKFDMEDDEAIYLHDTPAKALFGMPDRHRSHGCVRVENAVQFATMLAQQEGVLDQFQKAMQKDDEAFIKLPNADSGAADLPDRVLGRLERPVPAGRLRLGRQCREGARARAGPAAQDRSSRKAATTSGHSNG